MLLETNYQNYIKQPRIKTQEGRVVQEGDWLYYCYRDTPCIKAHVNRVLGSIGLECTVHTKRGSYNSCLGGEQLNHLHYCEPLQELPKGQDLQQFRKACYQHNMKLHIKSGKLQQGKAKLFYDGQELRVEWRCQPTKRGYRLLVSCTNRSHRERSFKTERVTSQSFDYVTLLSQIREQLDIPPKSF